MKSLFPSLLALMLLLAYSPGSLHAQMTSDSTDTEDTEMSTTGQAAEQTIVEIASENPDLSTLVQALKSAGYDAQLSDPTASWTVFAPTNEAFDALPAGVLEALLLPENANTLKYILLDHVSPNQLPSSKITADLESSDNGEIQPSMLHGDVTVMSDNGNVVLTDGMGNQANVTQTDIIASNGVIHLIDAVLVPANVDVMSLASEDAMGQMDEMKSDAAATADNMADEAETTANDLSQGAEQATAGMKQGAERAANTVEEGAEATANAAERTANRVAEGAEATANEMSQGAEQAAANVREGAERTANAAERTANGMANGTMDDDDMTETTNRTTANTASMTDATIGELAADNDNFSMLSDLVKEADLEDLLNSNSEFTVFAPGNSAFEALPDSTSSSLMENTDMLKNVLSYHVIASKISAEDLKSAIEKNDGFFRIQTLGGSSLIASMKDGEVILTDGNGEYATVTDTDIEAENGVIHTIDRVLTPRM